MALGYGGRSLPNVGAEYVEDPPEGIRIGIALSGGGIRSAAFNLGAMQALQHRHVLERADYLTGVSGGNYVASALTITGAYSNPGTDNGKPHWGSGSVEERHLRQHTNYLAPGRVGRLWLGLSMVYGFILNYLPFVLCAFIGGKLAGWALNWLGQPLERLRLNGLDLPAALPLKVLLIGAAALAVVAVLLVAYRRFIDIRRSPRNYGETRSEGVAANLVLLVGVIAVLLVLPPLASLYGKVSTAMISWLFHEPPEAFDTTQGRVVMAAVWLVLSLVLAIAALALSRRFRALRLMLVLSGLGSAGLLLVPLLSSLEFAARLGVRGTGDLLGVLAATAVVVLMSIKVHNRRYSMHLFYRERLNSVFALRRKLNEDGDVVCEPIGYDERLYFSKIGSKLRASGRKMPKLIVCCAVNLTSDEVPVGRFAESFTFEHDQSGGGLFGRRGTDWYEEQTGLPGTQLTLPSIMAVSGAALSPLMGRFTYPPLRFLMALTNVRLGVWIKNPLHPRWERKPEPPRGRLARLWASVLDGWHEPGALYVLREALGATKSTHRFIYLTDGGHWENTGLVELLRRRCTHVLCFDASSDPTGAGLDIGRAIALARSELGADVELDPRPTMPGEDGMSELMAVRGQVRYPDQGGEAKLIYGKAVLTRSGSWDLHAFKAREGRFPNHSTSKQMFTDEQFEAYRRLGYEAGTQAVDLLNIPDALLSPVRIVLS
ncbi:Patatin-like phospholipase [Lentzea fradiae]|uniref:Patatin-like phospholipase n=1 Tax=Lentzea fradiae TaxID=200378 RepID=A0A1G7KGZ8_9PSEU|nr:patatin-like phospholipase family protein [Lentzea fradiae]SDF36109.1 Patatin-like phospholipase [Lentzea fradiae]